MTCTIDTTAASHTWNLCAPGGAAGLTATVATATRAGTPGLNCDASAVAHYATAGTVAAAVVDGKGTSEATATAAWLCTETAVQLAARHGALTGLLTAGQLLADPGSKFVEVDGVAAVAVVRPGSPTTVVHDRLTVLVREHQRDPKALADTLVAEAARCAPSDDRDDATAVVITVSMAA
ncbi:hypothetical protein [Amycolatopsis sp. 195334CR]|uniref:hypothetical protein n=1 Tax=Amycolatopsis sp. 195334CR TaxID=2814588 RepID=UPI001A907C79|nr:hypothetical protein [Amycolatopsis sp. 195334CR]MBN6040013.1 hypothetical protein [Amycolatopsis sp. 195334CR]